MSTWAVRPSDAFGSMFWAFRPKTVWTIENSLVNGDSPLNSPLLIINWKSNVPLLAIRKPKNLISRGNRSHRLWRKLSWARFVDKSLCSTSEKREALYFMSFDMSLMDFERPCMSQLEAWARQHVTEGCSAAHVCCMKRDPLSLGSGTSFHHGYI